MHKHDTQVFLLQMSCNTVLNQLSLLPLPLSQLLLLLLLLLTRGHLGVWVFAQPQLALHAHHPLGAQPRTKLAGLWLRLRLKHNLQDSMHMQCIAESSECLQNSTQQYCCHFCCLLQLSHAGEIQLPISAEAGCGSPDGLAGQ
jgi:hypothetical protein